MKIPLPLSLSLIVTLMLAGCGTLPARDRLDLSPAPTPASTAPTADDTEPEDTPDATDEPAKIGETWTYNGGVEVSVTKLQSARVPQISSGGSPGDSAVIITVKVTNNGSGRLDVSQLSIDVRVGADGQPAEQVFAEGFSNAEGSLAKGRTYTYQAMFAADEPFKQVAIDVAPSWEHETALFEGRLS